MGLDARGGDASGYVSIARDNGNIFAAKRVGTWLDSKRKFRNRAAIGDMCILHSRWATCGIRTEQSQAHPFEIKRSGVTKLFGAHNGMIYNAKESAKHHGRGYTVDSKEMFELMADGDVDGIRELNGYGVAIYYVPGSDHINMVRLSDHSEICVVSLKSGGLAWGSTWDILGEALEYAEIEADAEFAVPEIGRVYKFRDDGVYRSDVTGIMFDPMPVEKDPEPWEIKMLAEWKAGMFDEHLRTQWERDLDDEEYPSIARSYYQ